MRARKKGETEWKDYKEVFGPDGQFQGLETAGYSESALDNYLRLGGTLNPDDEFQKARLESCPDVYVSQVMPLECFDLWSGEEDWSEFRKQAACAAMQGLLANPERKVSYGNYGDTRFYLDDEIAEIAVCCTDTLIEKLKKK